MTAAARRPAPAAATKCSVNACEGAQTCTCSWVHHEKMADGAESPQGKACSLRLCEKHAKKTKAGPVCEWHYGVAERRHKERQAAAKGVD
jgi:hypothetical protein